MQFPSIQVVYLRLRGADQPRPLSRPPSSTAISRSRLVRPQPPQQNPLSYPLNLCSIVQLADVISSNRYCPLVVELSRIGRSEKGICESPPKKHWRFHHDASQPVTATASVAYQCQRVAHFVTDECFHWNPMSDRKAPIPCIYT